MLVEGVDVVGQVDRKVRFLRRIPVDPMTGEAEWGLRSFQDDWDADSWGGDNVYDVYSLAELVWPDEVIQVEAASNRLYVTLSTQIIPKALLFSPRYSLDPILMFS